MNYPHGRPEYLNEVCVNCGGERGLHNHMNQACPKDPNANRDHTEYRTTTFAAAQPSKVQEKEIEEKEWKIVLNFFQGEYTLNPHTTIEEVIRELMQTYTLIKK